MKIFLLTLSIAFAVLTLIGAGFVLVSNGTANAGYAVVPMVIALASFSVYKAYTNKNK